MADDPSASRTPSTAESPAKVRPGLGPGRHGWGGWAGNGHGHGRPGAPAGVHGEATVRDRDGNFRVVTFQSGEITAVNGTTLTVKSADGASWTWTLAGDVKVRKNRDEAAVKDLAQGDDVRVAGERSGDTRTAKRVLELD